MFSFYILNFIKKKIFKFLYELKNTYFDILKLFSTLRNSLQYVLKIHEKVSNSNIKSYKNLQKLRLQFFEDFDEDVEFIKFFNENKDQILFYEQLLEEKKEYLRLLVLEEKILNSLNKLGNDTGSEEYKLMLSLLNVIKYGLKKRLLNYLDIYTDCLKLISSVGLKKKNLPKSPSLEIYFNIKWALKSVLLRFSGLFAIVLSFILLYLFCNSCLRGEYLEVNYFSFFNEIKLLLKEFETKIMFLFSLLLVLGYYFYFKIFLLNLNIVISSFFDISKLVLFLNKNNIFFDLNFVYFLIIILLVFSIFFHLILSFSHFSVLERKRNFLMILDYLIKFVSFYKIKFFLFGFVSLLLFLFFSF